MSNVQQKPLEEMTDQELRDLMLAEMNEQGEHKQDEQPRDSNGRFKPSDDEEVVYQRSIDLGDGAGVQVFEGKTLEELVDKLAQAQEHASRKIREQAAELKNRPAPLPAVEEEKPLTAEEKWLLQQRMVQDPMSVINEFVTERVAKLQEAQQREADAAAAAAAAQEQATNQWVAEHPDYYPSQKNGTKIQKYFEKFGLELTPENLTLAFNDLSESGLLEARPAEATNDNQEEPAAQQVTRRIVEPVQQQPVTTVRRKVVGSVSTKRQAPMEQATPELTEKQLREMPFHELEQLMYQQAR